MKKIRFSSRFKKELRLMKKRGKNIDKFDEVMSLLSENKPLSERFKDHQLQGKFIGCRDCHLEPDWLLIYRLTEDAVIFERTGTHSDLYLFQLNIPISDFVFLVKICSKNSVVEPTTNSHSSSQFFLKNPLS